MRAGTAGREQLRTLSRVLVVVACLAVLAVSVLAVRRLLAPETSRRTELTGPEPAAQLLAEQQLKLLAEQSEAVKEELRRLRDARIDLRRERIQLLADRFTVDGARQYDRVLLHNGCEVDVSVALYYLDLDESWITRGWWNVAPDETVTTDAMTRNAYLYFFAENRSVNRSWDGTGKERSMSLPIVDAKFDHLDGESFVYEGARTVSFYRRKTVDDWTDHVEEIRCYLEALDPPASGGS